MGNIEIYPYNLPDAKIMESILKFDSTIWHPDKTYIILGRASDLHTSIRVIDAVNDGIEVIRRSSGGESVVLSANMLVFSIKIDAESLKKPHEVFDIINKHLIIQFSEIGINNLYSKGISDLSIGDKKIMGSSMYLKNRTLFYHAVLNVSESVSLISKYLKHPKREPGYRLGRDHNNFVTSIHNEGYNISFEQLEISINKAVKNIGEYYSG